MPRIIKHHGSIFVPIHRGTLTSARSRLAAAATVTNELVQVLGIDLKYRGGFTFDHGNHEQVSNSVERHQWLELTFRPSMETCVCDLWIEDASSASGERHARLLSCPISEAYQSYMYPNGALLLGTKIKDLSDTDVS